MLPKISIKEFMIYNVMWLKALNTIHKTKSRAEKKKVKTSQTCPVALACGAD